MITPCKLEGKQEEQIIATDPAFAESAKKNHKILEDGSDSKLPSTEKSTSSALGKQNYP
jgi:hypothetical protein